MLCLCFLRWQYLKIHFFPCRSENFEKQFSISCNRNEYERQRGVAQSRKLVCVFVSLIERNEKFVSPRSGFTTSLNYKHNTLKHK